MKLHTIISGGQTGADLGGLKAGRDLDLTTGGVAPKGFRTEAGPAPELTDYWVEEHSSRLYPPRTAINILSSDATVVFGRSSSRGSRLTIRLARASDKPVLSLAPRPGDAKVFTDWLEDNDVGILNVAGNRESVSPGIEQSVRDFIVSSITSLGG